MSFVSMFPFILAPAAACAFVARLGPVMYRKALAHARTRRVERMRAIVDAHCPLRLVSAIHVRRNLPSYVPLPMEMRLLCIDVFGVSSVENAERAVLSGVVEFLHHGASKDDSRWVVARFDGARLIDAKYVDHDLGPYSDPRHIEHPPR